MENVKHPSSLRNLYLAATIADFGLPLIGPAFADYSSKVTTVAERWMHGRWLT